MGVHPNLKPWRPGQSGNLNGRPVGWRSAFSAGFTRDLAELGRKGQASILYTAEKQPAVFFATSARLLPSDVRVTVEQSLPGNLSMEDWQMMKEVVAAVQAIPDAANAPPGAVLRGVSTSRPPWCNSNKPPQLAGAWILKPPPNDYLQRWPVSKRVNSSKTDADGATFIDRVALAIA